jgi:hypothetical protein
MYRQSSEWAFLFSLFCTNIPIGLITQVNEKPGVLIKKTHISTFQLTSPLHHFDRQAINPLY